MVYKCMAEGTLYFLISAKEFVITTGLQPAVLLCGEMQR